MPLFIEFIPTSPEDMDGFFELAPVSLSDVVYDLGSGDGRLLFRALDKGAGSAVGIDLNAELVHAASETAREKGVHDKVSFVQGDVIEANLEGATLVLCYLFPTASAALKPKFESELKPGTRVVMESFYIHGWKEKAAISKGGKTFYLYIMPPEITGDT